MQNSVIVRIMIPLLISLKLMTVIVTMREITIALMILMTFSTLTMTTELL